MVKPNDQRRASADTTALSRALRESSLSEEQSSPSQSSPIKPGNIPVGGLADYCNSTKPPGRKYPQQTMTEFEDLYIDDTQEDSEGFADGGRNIKSKGETGGTKQAAKLTGTMGKKGQAAKESRSKADSKAAVLSQPAQAESKKAKGKSKKTEEGEDDEEEEKKDNSKENQWTPPPEARYVSCDECTRRRVRCYGATRTGPSDDWLCTPCQVRGRECHFSLIGHRHLNAKK